MSDLIDPIINKQTMLSLGFLSMKAVDAHKQFPIASASGNDVWWHPSTMIWFQGVPSGEQLFRTIYSVGKKEGIAEQLRKIQAVLGIFPP